MTPFNELQQLWNQQENPGAPRPSNEIILQAKKHAAQVNNKHRFTIAILALTLVLLLWYAIAVGASSNRFATGIILMLLALLLRLVAEYVSYRNFRRIDITINFTRYTLQMQQFFTRRKMIHFILTPITLLMYSGGFLLLLPIFRQLFSNAFYVYIIVSGTLFLGVFTLMIYRQAVKELQWLRFLLSVK